MLRLDGERFGITLGKVVFLPHIEGTVTDSTGAVVANAKVTASNIATGIATSRTTTSSGYFTINLLTPGTNTVSVSAQGFETLDQQNI